MAMETVQAYLKVAKLANKGQFERYTVRKLPKFASVPEFKPFLLENYSVELSPATNHSFTVGYMTLKVRYQNRQNASERLSKCKSVNSSDVSQQTTGSYRLWFVVFSRQRFFNQVYRYIGKKGENLSIIAIWFFCSKFRCVWTIPRPVDHISVIPLTRDYPIFE